MKIDVSDKEDVLYICSVSHMHKTISEAIKDAVKKKIQVMYMSFTRPAGIILSNLAKENLPKDDIVIVDCSGNKEARKHDNVIVIEEEENLTKMSITAFRFIHQPKEKLLIIDSLNVLIQYNRVEDVSKMIRNIIHKDDEKLTKMLVFYTDVSNKKAISHIEPFFDNVIEEKL